jgi:chromosome segregation protein
MHLKSLKIKGFKSFAEEVELIFESGITVIVGPNGCGKSNISDAVRWVLGEQSSKSLRCSRMEDVIFNGGAEGKPQNSAYVALRFSNEDGLLPMDSPEVEIARQLHRSGESRYFINGTPCLLRDIQDLFMDTGIGTNAYSLMEQNNIDLILNSKPQERRFLFDEVAGINKYKQRKKAALRKLEETEANLARINDVIIELERSTESLRQQAEVARRYLNLQEKLKSAEVERARRRFTELTEKLSGVRAKLKEVASRLSEKTAEIESLESSIVQFNSRRDQIDEEISDLARRIRKVETEIERTESNIAIYKDRQIAISQQRDQARSEIELIRRREEEIAKTVEDRAQERKRLQIELELESSKLKAHEAFISQIESRVSDARAEIEGLKSKMISLLDERTRLQNELSSLTSKLEYSENRLNRISSDEGSFRREMHEVNAQMDDLKRRSNLIQSEMVSMNADLKGIESEIKSGQEHLRKLEAEMSGIQQSLGMSLSRLNSLKELQNSYEGYYSGVRAVMKVRELKPEEFGGICGVMGELIRTEPEYELAIEVALGSGIQNVVVETAEDAQRAIEFLKETRSGRVTFLPLDILRARRYAGDKSLLNHPGVIGLASELVSFDPKYRVAVDYLLGNTLIVEDLDVAISISRRFKPASRLVTLEGEIINTSGAITGGSTSSAVSGLLGRGREIEELERKVEKLSIRLKEKEAERKGLSAKIGALQRRKQEIISSSQEKRVQMAEISKEMQGLEGRRKRLERELEVLRSEGEVIRRELEELSNRRSEVETRLAEIEKAYSAFNRKSQRLSEQIESEMAKKDEIEKLCNEKRVQLATIREKIRNIDEAIKSMETERQRMRQRAEEFAQNLRSAEESQREISEKIEEEQHKFLQLEQTLFDLSERSAALEREKEELLQNIEGAERKLRSLRRSISSIESRKHELDVTQTELQIQIDNLRSSIRERFNLPIETAQPTMSELSDEDLTTMIEGLKEEIEGMGTVNLKAIEDYRQHKERLDFMVGQRDDLVEARDSIYKVIDRINATSRRIFLESFNEVNENFKEVFKELFEGGEAELVLSGDDVLECGVDIVAHPPGKRPGSIALLSGGERSLVAIALLFGIFKLKPSPFCILDEVDAALDEANVLRFTKLIKGFSENIQFIIITHNKRTMEIAEAMYGVTMEKAGVSKLVSVKFAA